MPAFMLATCGGNADWLFTDAGTTTSHDVDGFLAGGQIGYNFQVDNFVFGIEGDVSWSDADGSSLCPNPDFTCATELNWMGTVRARAGVALDRVLLYGTGGVAFGDFDFAATDPVEAFTDSQTYTGWTIGAGAEVALVDNLSVKAEYRYVDFGDEDLVLVAPGDTAPVNAEIDAHTLYVGLNYRFAGGLFQ